MTLMITYEKLKEKKLQNILKPKIFPIKKKYTFSNQVINLLISLFKRKFLLEQMHLKIQFI